MLQIADISFTLTDDEVADGMVLTCMSRPVSDEVRRRARGRGTPALGRQRLPCAESQPAVVAGDAWTVCV